MNKKVTSASQTGGETVILALVAALIGALTWLIVRRFIRTKGRLPPGPFGLPLVGVTHRLGPHPQVTLSQWGEKYGNVYSFYFGPTLAVVLNDYEAIKAGFVEQADAFSGRPYTFVFEFLNKGPHGLGQSEGTFFREQRRFLLKSFHDLGVGKSRFEQLCLEESDSLVESMLQHGNTPFNPRHEADSSVANIICALVFGHRFARKDPVLRSVLENQHVVTELIASAGPLQVLPFLRFFPPYKNIWKRFSEVAEMGLTQFTLPEVARIQKEYDPSQEPQCVVEHFIQHRAKLGNTAAIEGDELLNTLNMIANIQGLFGAGTETSISTLTWYILFLVRYPEVQFKCHQEIVNNVGFDRQVTWDDRASLPYVEAFLLEVWRRSNLVPLALLHRTTEDAYLNGYFIPKHTTVIPNVWNVHRDERHWDKPMEFVPERFLDAADGKVNRTLTNMPFGIGKRACVGEGIARMEIFLFVANLLQRVEFYVPKELQSELPTEDEFTTGITVQPKSYTVCARPRVAK